VLKRNPDPQAACTNWLPFPVVKTQRPVTVTACAKITEKEEHDSCGLRKLGKKPLTRIRLVATMAELRF
jgi:hypothetical protein